MTDEIERSLRALSSDLPKAQENLDEEAKDQLIHALGGPLTVTSILAAKTQFPLSRIPFLFSSLDSQLVINVLTNDMKAAILRAGANPGTTALAELKSSRRGK